MHIPLYQVDAFTPRLFGGNPAAVCPLPEWLDDATLQAIASENNLSETAFFVPGEPERRLRWFTPACEVDLCGHATLAAAFVIMTELEPETGSLRFTTASGELTVTRSGDRYTLDFPSRPAAHDGDLEAVAAALGTRPQSLLASRDYLAVFASEQDVRALAPDMSKLAALPRFALIATAPGSDCDFVSRFFAPAQGVPEDPVTGSAHCTLIPYWAGVLGKSELHARQVSKRGGELFCQLAGDRVFISGNAVLYSRGTICL